MLDAELGYKSLKAFKELSILNHQALSELRDFVLFGQVFLKRIGA